MDVELLIPHKKKVIIDLVSSDSSDSSDSGSSSSDAGVAGGFTLRGPNIEADEDFDPHCVFPHELALSGSQVQFLNDKVHQQQPTRPFYVCKINKSNIGKFKSKNVEFTKINKSKMVIMATWSICFLFSIIYVPHL
jgi:hypothetical protein